MSYTAISAAIIAALGEVEELRGVYAFDNPSPAGYPMACVYPKGESSGQILDTKSDLHRYTFAVRLYDRAPKEKMAETEERMLPLVDAVLAKLSAYGPLRADDRLLDALSAEWGWTEGPGPTIRGCEITVACRAPIDIS